MLHVPRSFKKNPRVMPDPYFNGVVGKRTKKAVRDQAQAVVKLRKRLDAAQRKRRKAYEERKRKRQHEAESEQPNFGADDDGSLTKVDAPYSASAVDNATELCRFVPVDT